MYIIQLGRYNIIYTWYIDTQLGRSTWYTFESTLLNSTNLEET